MGFENKSRKNTIMTAIDYTLTIERDGGIDKGAYTRVLEGEKSASVLGSRGRYLFIYMQYLT